MCYTIITILPERARTKKGIKKMATRYEINKIVSTFKAYNNVSVRITEKAEEELRRLIDEFGADLLEEVAGTVKADNLWDVFNRPFLNYYRANKKVYAEAEQKTEELEKQLEAKKKIDLEQEKSNMSLGLVEKALAKVMMEEYAPKLAENVFKNAQDFIEKEYGKIVRTIEYQIPEHGALNEVTHEEFETVLNFVMMNEPVMLIGPAGTGKNVICKQVAKILGFDFYFSNAVTQEYKITGFIDANGVYQETEFYKAFKNGGVFMLDEIDASIPEVLVILNAAIANRYFDFPNGKIEAHENFRVIAAGNTYGLGASYQYVGRNQLDAASLDRFAQVEINYSPRIEESLTEDKDLIEFIRKFRKACYDNSNNHIVSYRTITRLNKMAKIMPIEKCLKSCLLKNMEEDSLNMIVRKFGNNTRWEQALRACANS